VERNMPASKRVERVFTWAKVRVLKSIRVAKGNKVEGSSATEGLRLSRRKYGRASEVKA